MKCASTIKRKLHPQKDKVDYTDHNSFSNLKDQMKNVYHIMPTLWVKLTKALTSLKYSMI